MKSDLLRTGIMSERWHSAKSYGLWIMKGSFITGKVVCSRQASCQNADNQTTTDIQLILTDYEWLFYLMLRLHVSSTSNEISWSVITWKVIYYGRASCQNSDNQTMIDIQISPTGFEGLFHLMLRLQVSSASNEIYPFGRLSHEKLYICKGHNAITPTFKQLLTHK